MPPMAIGLHLRKRSWWPSNAWKARRYVQMNMWIMKKSWHY